MNKKIGRNDPCPCGSGKKYKNCCLPKKDNDTLIRHLSDKIYKIIISDYFDYLVESFVLVCPYAFDYMPIDIFDERDEAFYYEVDNYLREHNEEFLLSVDNLVYNWFSLQGPYAKNEDVSWVEVVEKEFPNYFTKEELYVLYDNIYESNLSLFEVIDINFGKNVIVQDLFTGKKYTVVEHIGSFSLQKYDCLMTRIIKYQEKNFFSFAVVYVPKFKQDYILEIVSNMYKKEKKDITIEYFLKVFPTALTYTVHKANTEAQKINLVNTTGEEINFCRLNYEILNYNELIKQLDGIEEFDKIEENKKAKIAEYTWFGGEMNGKKSSAKTNNLLNINKSHFVNSPSGNVILGHLWIKNNELKAECNSKKRANRLNSILKKIGENLLKFRGQEIKTPNEVMYENNSTLNEEKEKERIPDDVKAQVMEEFHLDFYKKLFTKKIPDLNNKSPKECLKTKEGRQLLYNLLKQHENMELHKKANGEYWFDINKVYDMWKLPRK